MSVLMMTSHEMAIHIAKQAQEKRLSLNFSQQTLSARSGVSYGVLKKFERTGKISLESLLKIAFTLGCFEKFKDLFLVDDFQSIRSLDELMSEKKRKRGRE